MSGRLRKLFLGIITVIFILLAAEGVARIFFNPTDYLWRRLVPDDMLRHRVEPNTRGHDAWGFRNRLVPAHADIVALGDSQTYGTSSLAKHSWPSILGELKGQEVYNMSLGGYSPAEYLYLMEDKALGLGPNLIIAGFYLGNDLTDTYTAVYSVPYWKDLRNPDIASMHAQVSPNQNKASLKKNPRASFMKQIYLIADWFAGNSVLYRIVNTSSLGDYIRQKKMIGAGLEVVMFEDKENDIYTGFTPGRWLDNLDLKNPEVQEGLGLTLNFFNQMNELAERNNVRFLVVLIPTKESVFADFIEGNSRLESSEKIDRLIEAERQINNIAKSYFKEHDISYLDVLNPLKEAVHNEQLYPNNYSSHPNKNGNRIMAGSIAQWMDSR